MDQPLVLVTGATGYVGGRLVPRLLEAGYRVRVMARDRARLQGRHWLDRVEVVEADILKPQSLPTVLAGVTDAYYLVHSMKGGPDLTGRDLAAARNFGMAAKAAGLSRIIYLGGLGDPSAALSPHLRSRHQTGDLLRQSGVPVTEFRCAVIVGSGSVSFEIIRNMTERLPIVVCPRWLRTLVQPIAIRQVLAYLLAALQSPDSSGKIIEIGGPDVLSYRDMMEGYARARRMARVFIPFPARAPLLSSYWVHLLTPIPSHMAQPLIDALGDEMVVHDDLAKRLFPGVVPIDYETALCLALERLDTEQVETIWSDALVTSQGDVPPVTLSFQPGLIVERRRRIVDAPASDVFQIFTGVGGERGWLYADWTWTARGAIDRVLGGVGMRRGRRHPDEILVGEALDVWRVEAVQRDRLLRLRAEMKVPGPAWLEFQTYQRADGGSLLVQTAYFAPKGLSGLLYWYLLYPIHGKIFSGLIREIARRAEALPASPGLPEAPARSLSR